MRRRSWVVKVLRASWVNPLALLHPKVADALRWISTRETENLSEVHWTANNALGTVNQPCVPEGAPDKHHAVAEGPVSAHLAVGGQDSPCLGASEQLAAAVTTGFWGRCWCAHCRWKQSAWPSSSLAQAHVLEKQPLPILRLPSTLSWRFVSCPWSSSLYIP